MTDGRGPPGSVRELLREATKRLTKAGSESARLDSELLLAHVLGVDRTTVLAHPDAIAGGGQREAFESILRRRQEGEPVAYIRGLKEFYGLAFSVDRRALIPRPETERLVELALERVREVLASSPRAADSQPMRLWDVGTGSGAVAVALAVILDRGGYGAYVTIVASDVSLDALQVATENLAAHGVADRVDLRKGDLLDVPMAASEPVDLIVANLPYVPSATLPAVPMAASFEPEIALDGGPDGMDLIRRLLAGSPRVIGEGGMVLLEIGSDQADGAIAAAAELLPDWPAIIHTDLGGQPRVLEVSRS